MTGPKRQGREAKNYCCSTNGPYIYRYNSELCVWANAPAKMHMGKVKGVIDLCGTGALTVKLKFGLSFLPLAARTVFSISSLATCKIKRGHGQVETGPFPLLH